MNTTFRARLQFLCCKGEADVTVTYMLDAGVRTFRNGDPGYPPTEETTLDIPHSLEGEPKCPLCGAELTITQYDQLTTEALRQLPEDEQPEPDELDDNVPNDMFERHPDDEEC